MGAPRDCAGFRRMVMVVSVSLSGLSESYSGIIGAETRCLWNFRIRFNVKLSSAQDITQILFVTQKI